jgi:hypothetical protein
MQGSKHAIDLFQGCDGSSPGLDGDLLAIQRKKNVPANYNSA